ncbi:MAG: methionine ABC transporter ATP-binding protein [Acidaminococcales bacterium]|jgi:D-methionine transport system ATP-binding protein|nr:methionine ABC transporter ATP-binding protein [Acidaminococcales bacterium]
MIKIDNLTKTYTSKEGDIQALNGVSLHIGRGRIFGVIGQSGAGKSTLVRCINMLERPTSGTVTVDGKDMGALAGKGLLRARQEISMIFQHFNLLASRTVFDNVAFPLEIQGLKKAAITERVLPLLELVGLRERARYYPSQLSGGQKQRVGIARALASRPKVLLCDEATSALDPQTTKSILALLKDINKQFDLTIVLITHEMIVIKEICDQLAMIENGRIVEEGGVLEVFANPRTPTAREFIGTALSQHLPDFLSKIGLSPVPVDGGKWLVQLSFIGASARQPVLSGAIRAYNVDVSIICGNIDYIKDTPFGTLVAEVSGKKDDIESALSYLGRQKLRVEVLGYVP